MRVHQLPKVSRYEDIGVLGAVITWSGETMSDTRE